MKSLSRLLGKRRRRIVGLACDADRVVGALLEAESLSSPVAGQTLTWELLDSLSVPYPDAVREEILDLDRDPNDVLARLTRLHFVLGHLFADAVEELARDAGTPIGTIDAVASSGHSVCHFPRFAEKGYVRPGPGEGAFARVEPAGAGWISAATLAVGEPAVIAERTGIPVLAGFRSRDVAAGGTGGPLMPRVDHILFSDPDRPRLVLSVGTNAEITALSAGGAPEDVLAMQVGPGTGLGDTLAGELSGGRKRADSGGAAARRGRPDDKLVEEILGDPFFALSPPRTGSAGRFGAAFARSFVERGRERGLSEASILASAVRITAGAVRSAYERFVRPVFEVSEVIVSGAGGANVALLEHLSELFKGVSVVPSDYYGMDVDAKEAAAFALLAHWSLDGEAGNLPAATGAAAPVILGAITPGGGDLS